LGDFDLASLDTPQSEERAAPTSPARAAFHFLAIVWLLCLVAQAYLAGLAVMGESSWWAAHRAFGGFLVLPALLILALAWIGRLGRDLRLLASLQLGLVLVQFATIVMRYYGVDPIVSALHGPNALMLFAVAVASVRRACAPQLG